MFHEGVDWDVLMRLAVALGLGGLVGLERERHHKEKAVLAGVRTMPLVSLSGALLVIVAQETAEPLLVVAGLLVFGGLAFFMALSKEAEGSTGLTTPVAFIATFLVGVLVGYEMFLVATVAGVATTLILFHKEHLHRVADVLSADELRSAMYFIVIAFILYPLSLDARPIGPGGIVDLREAMLIVVLVSVLSFLGFLALRRWGPGRGIPAVGLLGGLASSVAAVAAIVAMPLATAALRRAASIGILAAAAAMLARNLAIALLVERSFVLAFWLALPFSVVGVVVAVGWAQGAMRRPAGPTDPAPPGAPFDPRASGIKSPFAVVPALRFGLLFLVLTLAAHYLGELPGLGDEAVYLAAAGGLVTTGAVVASMAVLYGSGQLAAATAASVCLVAAALSLLVKVTMARSAGPEVARPTLPYLGVGAALLVASAVAVRMVPA